MTFVCVNMTHRWALRFRDRHVSVSMTCQSVLGSPSMHEAFKNVWIYILTPLYIFMVYCLKHRDSFVVNKSVF